MKPWFAIGVESHKAIITALTPVNQKERLTERQEDIDDIEH
jgi:hypothetical protein